MRSMNMHACTTDARTLGMNDRRLRDDDEMTMPCYREDHRAVVPRGKGTFVFFRVCRPVLLPPPPLLVQRRRSAQDRPLSTPGLRGDFSGMQCLALPLHLLLDSSEYHGTLFLPVRSFDSALHCCYVLFELVVRSTC